MSSKVPDYKISIRLDRRRIKDDNSYPVKLRVYGKASKKEKWYSLGIYLTEREFGPSFQKHSSF